MAFNRFSSKPISKDTKSNQHQERKILHLRRPNISQEPPQADAKSKQEENVSISPAQPVQNLAKNPEITENINAQYITQSFLCLEQALCAAFAVPPFLAHALSLQANDDNDLISYFNAPAWQTGKRLNQELMALNLKNTAPAPCGRPSFKAPTDTNDNSNQVSSSQATDTLASWLYALLVDYAALYPDTCIQLIVHLAKNQKLTPIMLGVVNNRQWSKQPELALFLEGIINAKDILAKDKIPAGLTKIRYFRLNRSIQEASDLLQISLFEHNFVPAAWALNKLKRLGEELSGKLTLSPEKRAEFAQNQLFEGDVSDQELEFFQQQRQAAQATQALFGQQAAFTEQDSLSRALETISPTLAYAFSQGSVVAASALLKQIYSKYEQTQQYLYLNLLDIMLVDTVLALSQTLCKLRSNEHLIPSQKAKANFGVLAITFKEALVDKLQQNLCDFALPSPEALLIPWHELQIEVLATDTEADHTLLPNIWSLVDNISNLVYNLTQRLPRSHLLQKLQAKLQQDTTHLLQGNEGYLHTAGDKDSAITGTYWQKMQLNYLGLCSLPILTILRKLTAGNNNNHAKADQSYANLETLAPCGSHSHLASLCTASFDLNQCSWASLVYLNLDNLAIRLEQGAALLDLAKVYAQLKHPAASVICALSIRFQELLAGTPWQRYLSWELFTEILEQQIATTQRDQSKKKLQPVSNPALMGMRAYDFLVHQHNNPAASYLLAVLHLQGSMGKIDYKKVFAYAQDALNSILDTQDSSFDKDKTCSLTPTHRDFFSKSVLTKDKQSFLSSQHAVSASSTLPISKKTLDPNAQTEKCKREAQSTHATCATPKKSLLDSIVESSAKLQQAKNPQLLLSQTQPPQGLILNKPTQTVKPTPLVPDHLDTLNQEQCALLCLDKAQASPGTLHAEQATSRLTLSLNKSQGRQTLNLKPPLSLKHNSKQDRVQAIQKANARDQDSINLPLADTVGSQELKLCSLLTPLSLMPQECNRTADIAGLRTLPQTLYLNQQEFTHEALALKQGYTYLLPELHTIMSIMYLKGYGTGQNSNAATFAALALAHCLDELDTKQCKLTCQRLQNIFNWFKEDKLTFFQSLQNNQGESAVWILMALAHSYGLAGLPIDIKRRKYFIDLLKKRGISLNKEQNLARKRDQTKSKGRR